MNPIACTPGIERAHPHPLLLRVLRSSLRSRRGGDVARSAAHPPLRTERRCPLTSSRGEEFGKQWTKRLSACELLARLNGFCNLGALIRAIEDCKHYQDRQHGRRSW